MDAAERYGKHLHAIPSMLSQMKTSGSLSPCPEQSKATGGPYGEARFGHGYLGRKRGNLLPYVVWKEAS